MKDAAAISACTEPAYADLMAIDWKPELRGDFEAAMKEGLAIVSYDCKTLKLQPSCSLEGSYGYLGTTRREKKIEMSTKDELAANLPVGGLTWLSDLGAKFGRGTSLAARLVMVGKQSAGKKQASKGDLKGGCDNATHYVRAATIGAFVVASGSQAELAANVKIVGKGSAPVRRARPRSSPRMATSTPARNRQPTIRRRRISVVPWFASSSSRSPNRL